MDIYQRKSRWKIWLGILGAMIILASFLYTQYLTPKLKAEERNRIQNFADAWAEQNPPTEDVESQEYQDWLGKDLTRFQAVIEGNTTIPTIIVNDRGNIELAKNYASSKMYLSTSDKAQKLDTAYLGTRVRLLQNNGKEPVIIDNGYFKQYLWYEDSQILTLLNYFPFFQMGLVIAFIGLGYLGFSSSRRAEQNRVWAGMAKETAHQLGTPITAIIGWIEHLKAMHESDDASMEVLGEFRKDVTRLELIADRFSKIGSEPELTRHSLADVLQDVFSYMERRSPRKVNFNLPDIAPELEVNINEHLFEWVIENLLRNAVDSLDGSGEISAAIEVQSDNITILISDTGKGIPTSKFKTVFQPGFTTKKRGWGLGLSLAKRIIESYHSGKIFVKSSTLKKGTTFAIVMPRV